ncbi:hypothetical protein BD413DRAFT_463727 [Trametes elegans]|nr:hypothetical protein BD413DRAFT_463727 [Trametes elegans]
MHAFGTLLTVLVLGLELATVSAAPLRRRTCRPASQISAIASSIKASSTVSEAVSTPIAATATHVASSESASVTASTKASSIKASGTKTSSTEASASSTSESAAAATSSASSATSGLLKKLFPVSFTSFWTTSTASSDALPLDDSTLGITHLLSALSHDYVTAPDNKYSMKAHYPKGSYTFTHKPQGGLSFYATGPKSVDLESAKEVTFGYSVYFEDDFEFNMGGKLPGLYGGDDAETAVSCSGGRQDDRDKCFSTRFMWRTDGKGEAYTYLTNTNNANQALCNVAPESDCNPDYGASVGRGSFSFKAGTRTTLAQRVLLNDVGKANGELEIFVEGKSIFTVKGLTYRTSDAGRFRGAQVQTFFGGSKVEWASPRDQSAYFSDFSLAVTKQL